MKTVADMRGIGGKYSDVLYGRPLMLLYNLRKNKFLTKLLSCKVGLFNKLICVRT